MNVTRTTPTTLNYVKLLTLNYKNLVAQIKTSCLLSCETWVFVINSFYFNK